MVDPDKVKALDYDISEVEMLMPKLEEGLVSSYEYIIDKLIFYSAGIIGLSINFVVLIAKDFRHQLSDYFLGIPLVYFCIGAWISLFLAILFSLFAYFFRHGIFVDRVLGSVDNINTLKTGKPIAKPKKTHDSMNEEFKKSFKWSVGLFVFGNLLLILFASRIVLLLSIG